MTTRRVIAFLAIAPVAVAAGCGGSESSEPVATTQVTMAKSYRFDPKVIEVDAGSTVIWTNDDNFMHTVKLDGQEDHKVDRARASRSRSTRLARTTTSAPSTART